MAPKRKKIQRILVVNDDGINGEGLRPLIKALKPLGRVTTLVPERERSTASHSLTLHKPLRLGDAPGGIHTLNGTPADCARFGVLCLMKEKVDLVVSGINRGHNLGQDVLYSGTVAAAAEASLLGVPAIAASRGLGPGGYEAGAAFIRKLARRVLKDGLPAGRVLNVNFPPISASRIRGARLTRLGDRVYDKKIVVRSDPRGGSYFWIAGRGVKNVLANGTDVRAVSERFIAVTPLTLDTTDYSALAEMETWAL
jgi:5'-nucleotidase